MFENSEVHSSFQIKVPNLFKQLAEQRGIEGFFLVAAVFANLFCFYYFILNDKLVIIGKLELGRICKLGMSG